MKFYSRLVARKISSWIVLVAVLVLTTGCGAFPPPPERTEVIGTWEAREGHRVARIEMDGDGALRIERLPRAAIAEAHVQALDWDDTVDASGSWSYSEPGPEAFSEARVHFSLAEVMGSDTKELFAIYLRQGRLQLYYGDPEMGSVLAFSLVAGPSTPLPQTVKRADLIGRWVSEDAGEVWLKKDETFVWSGAPLWLVALPGGGDADTPTLDIVGQWSHTEEPLPLGKTAGPLLSFEGTYGHQPRLVDAIGLYLRETDGGFALVTGGRDARWELQQ